MKRVLALKGKVQFCTSSATSVGLVLIIVLDQGLSAPVEAVSKIGRNRASLQGRIRFPSRHNSLLLVVLRVMVPRNKAIRTARHH